MTTPQVPVPATAADNSKGIQPTEYVILQKTAGSHNWTPISNAGGVEFTAARSANEAIKKAAGEKAGQYVAVPARSWKPVTVTVETTTSVKLT